MPSFVLCLPHCELTDSPERRALSTTWVKKMETEKKSVSLYDLAAELAVLKQRLIDNGDDDQTIADTLEGESLDFEQKITACAYALKELLAYAKMRREAIEESEEQVKKLEKRADSLEKYMIKAMQLSGYSAVQCRDFEINQRKTPPRVDVFDENAIPAKFIRVLDPKLAINKKSISEAIKAGQDVPGARLTQDIRLNIK